MNKDLKGESIAILFQAKALILSLSDSEFNYVDSSLFLSSTGQHFRHVLDFYNSFAGSYASGEIDYDKRERNIEVAEKRDICIAKIDEIISFFKTMEADMSSAVFVSTVEGTTGLSSRAESTIGREIQFMLSHTIHHYALIAMILRSQGLTLPPHFGIARSTIEYYDY